MLRDGQFLREEPIKIGEHYVHTMRRKDITYEEHFIQDVLLGTGVHVESKLKKLMEGLMSI